MKGLFLLFFLISIANNLYPKDEQLGFAFIPGYDLNTTTGGINGKTVFANNVDELKSYMDSNDPLIIQFSGTMELSGMTPLRSNKTLIGIGDSARIINGGLEIYKRSNIIIKNITFENSPDDCIKINQNSHHIWVDHCSFTDGPIADPKAESHDGLFDITRGSSYITISYCHFYNHSKNILIGHSDSYTDDIGYLKVTLHHNWFDGTIQRNPRVRFGEIHVFNNFYSSNSLYGIASTMDADVVVEGNYFYNVSYPMYSGYAESGPGDIIERFNIYHNSGTPVTRGEAFDPTKYYSYYLDSTNLIPMMIMKNAGAGSIKNIYIDTTIFSINVSKPPIEEPVDNINSFNSNNSKIWDVQLNKFFLKINLKKEGYLSVNIYNVSGQKLFQLFDSFLYSGDYCFNIDKTRFNTGIYFAKIIFEDEIKIQKIIIR
jgi:pectate lyase